MIRRYRIRRCRSVGAMLFAVALTSLSACSTSKFLVGAFYDRADDKAIDKVDDWLDFTDVQRREFEAYIGTFHTWHRRRELPRYAILLRTVAAGLSTFDQATPADFERWGEDIKELVQAGRDCHPARFAHPLARSLSDAQIDRVERRWIEQQEENRKPEGAREQRIVRRVDRIDTWVGRLGVDLDDDQLVLIRDTFVQQKSLRRRYQQLNDNWRSKLFAIGRDQEAPDYDALFDIHVEAGFQQIEKAYPEEFEANRQNWLDFAVRFEKTLSKLQRREILGWLNDMADTLDAVSRDEPDWLPAEDPSYGCIVEGAGAASGLSRP